MVEYMTLSTVLPDEETAPQDGVIDPDTVVPSAGAGETEPPSGELPPEGKPGEAPGETPPVKPDEVPVAPDEGMVPTVGANEETGELVEVPVADDATEKKLDPLTTALLGAVVVLAVVAAVLGAMLLRKNKREQALRVHPCGGSSIDIGKLHAIGDRESQQDCFAVSPEELYRSRGLLAVVADGMGGLADGDKVSEAVVTAMMDGFLSGSETGNILLPLAEQANRKVNQLLGPAGIGKSGSTMVAGLVREGRFHYISIGDSRICLFRDGQLMQLNREHVYVHELSIQALNGIGSLPSAAAHPKAAGLTSYLGMGQLKYVDIPAEGVLIREGDKFILMSDGVYNALQEEELSAALMNDAEKAAEMIGAKIAEKAYRNQDNYSAVILGF